jgi:large subunit ribosomal protein L25
MAMIELAAAEAPMVDVDGERGRERFSSMDEIVLGAERRRVIGKQVKRLRRDGRVPGIVYGPVVTETVPVTVDRREFDRFYRSNGHATLFTLRWDGGEQAVFIREVQQDPIRRAPIHVDFFAPNLRKALRTLVPLVFHHQNADADGVLTQLRTEVEVEGLPAAIPSQIDADISGLVAVGDGLHVADLTLPDGVVAITEGEELLVHLVAETMPEPEAETTEATETGEEAAASAVEGDEAASDGCAA